MAEHDKYCGCAGCNTARKLSRGEPVTSTYTRERVSSDGYINKETWITNVDRKGNITEDQLFFKDLKGVDNLNSDYYWDESEKQYKRKRSA